LRSQLAFLGATLASSSCGDARVTATGGETQKR
jgi:hypothetical protein